MTVAAVVGVVGGCDVIVKAVVVIAAAAAAAAADVDY